MFVDGRAMTATEIAEAFDAEVIADLLSEATPGTREWTILTHAAAQKPVQCSCEGATEVEHLRSGYRRAASALLRAAEDLTQAHKVITQELPVEVSHG